MKTTPYTLLEIPSLPHTPGVAYNALPDEAATHLIAELNERATACRQPFHLSPLSHTLHLRGLCLGLTSSTKPIAVFYVADNGEYAWTFIDHIHVIQPAQAKCMIAPPLEVGMQYWFRPSQSRAGGIRAEAVGPVGPLKSHYLATHTPSQKPAPRKAKSTDSEGDAGLPPALRPREEEAEFEPLQSWDKLGL